MSEDLSPEDEMIAKVSDYLDGLLSGPEKDDVDKKIATDPAWKQTHEEMVRYDTPQPQLQEAG